MSALDIYSGTKTPLRRVVVLLPEDELKEIDDWGVPAGMPNRTRAIRELIGRGLSAAMDAASENKTAPHQA